MNPSPDLVSEKLPFLIASAKPVRIRELMKF